jgi:hypothetical protein
MNRLLKFCSRSCHPEFQTRPTASAVFFFALCLIVFKAGSFTPFESARAATMSLESGSSGQKGRMRIRSDEFGRSGIAMAASRPSSRIRALVPVAGCAIVA